MEHLYVPADGYETYCSHSSWGLVPEIAIYEIELPGAGATGDENGTTITWYASNVAETDYYIVNVYADAALEQLAEMQTVSINARSEQAMTCNFDTLEPYTDYWVTIEGVDYDGEPCYFDYLAMRTGSTSSSIPAFETEIDNTVKAIYDLTGRRLSAPGKGINILLYSDGKVVKRVEN